MLGFVSTFVTEARGGENEVRVKSHRTGRAKLCRDMKPYSTASVKVAEQCIKQQKKMVMVVSGIGDC